MMRLRIVAALSLIGLLAHGIAHAAAPSPPSGTVVAPAATTAGPAPAAPPPAAQPPAASPPAASPPADPSYMPALELGVRGSVGGIWLGSAQDLYGSSDAFALGMNNNSLGGTLGVGFVPNEHRRSGLMVRGAYQVGHTSLDLESHYASIGLDFFVRLIPDLSLVPTLRGDWLLLKRVTTDNAPDIQHWGYGAGVGLDYTFVHVQEYGFFVRPELSGTLIPHAVTEPRTGLLSGVLTLGVRYLPD